jgi:peptidoglycan/LPS O-acetylase OafA/YrhL
VPRLHLRFVDGLRGLAAVYIVLHHAWLQTWPKIVWGDAPTGPWIQALTGWLLYGHFAVACFVTISGFCLMLPVLRNGGQLSCSLRNFFFWRAKRILPTYMASLLISIVLVSEFISNGTHTLYDVSLPITWEGLITHILLIHNLFASTRAQINGPLWYIAVLCQLYLCFPLLLEARRRFGMHMVLAATFSVSMAILAITERTPNAGLNPQYLFVFALGMYGAEASLRLRSRFYVWLGCASALIFLAMLIIIGLRKVPFEDLPAGIASMCLLTYCAQRPKSIITRILSWGPFAVLGTFSYSLYLICSKSFGSTSCFPWALGKLRRS